MIPGPLKRQGLLKPAVLFSLAASAFAALLVIVILEGGSGGTLTVTNTADDGPGSLRQAIIDANATSAADTINFSASEPIVLSSTLPPISDPAGLTIDGAGQSVTISGNNSAGVMIVGPAGKLDLRNVTIANGSVSPGSGGGILNTGGTLTLTNSTVSNNAAHVEGGGITNRGTTTLINSTVSGNSAPGGFGGGIYNNFTGTLTLTNSTVSGNSAADGLGGGIRNEGSVSLKNTIVANNPGGSCSGDPITSLGHNLSSDGTCRLRDSDLINADPILGPLANDGGLTETHQLLQGSPAIDAGSSDCPPPATDQRGVSRPQDGDGAAGAVCDIGAFEFAAGGTLGPTTPVPTPSPSPSPSPSPTQTPSPTPGPTPAPSPTPTPTPPPSPSPSPSPGARSAESPTPTPSPEPEPEPASTPVCPVDNDDGEGDRDDRNGDRDRRDRDDDDDDRRPCPGGRERDGDDNEEADDEDDDD